MKKSDAITAGIATAKENNTPIVVVRDPRSISLEPYDFCPSIARQMLHRDSVIVAEISPNGSVVHVQEVSAIDTDRIKERVRDCRQVMRHLNDELLTSPDTMVDLLEELAVLDRAFGHVLQKI
jgi:hypothetical protein